MSTPNDPQRFPPEQAAAPELGTDRLGTHGLGTDHLSADRLGADRLGADRLGADRLGTHRLGADRLGVPDQGAASPEVGYGQEATGAAYPPPWLRAPAPEDAGVDNYVDNYEGGAPGVPAFEYSAAPTTVMDAPTGSLSAEQLGMRLQPPNSYHSGEYHSGEEPLASDAETLRRAPTAAAERPLRGRVPRRASLQVKRVDPWSVLKLAAVLGVALFLVWMFAVGVLYAVLDGMGVWDKLNGTFSELSPDSASSGPLITAGGVFGVAALVGIINTILFTALTSVAAFIYNVSADVAGGIEVTLSECD